MDDMLIFSFAREASIPEGQHPYTLLKVVPEYNVLTDSGIKNRLVFTFELIIDGEAKQLTKRFNYSKHPNSFLMSFMRMLGNAYHMDNKINLSELVGTKGLMTISHVPDEQGNVFENITDIFVPDVNSEE